MPILILNGNAFPIFTGFSGTAYRFLISDLDGKIVEHWDAVQQVPEEGANGNGMV